MRNYRTAFAALLLALALSTPASAGIIYAEKTSPTPTPVPVSASIMQGDAADGEGIIHTDATEAAPSATSAMIAEVAGVLLQSVLTLF